MNPFDTIVKLREEQKKFVGYAEKATTEEDLINLCKKYLAHKKIEPERKESDFDTDRIWLQPPPPRFQHEIKKFESNRMVPEYYNDEYDYNLEAAIKKDLVQDIMYQIINSHDGWISFKMNQHHYERKQSIQATMSVAKVK